LLRSTQAAGCPLDDGRRLLVAHGKEPVNRRVVSVGRGAGDAVEFGELMESLRRDLAPVGALEEMLVEKIAVCYWRQKRVLTCEAGWIGDNYREYALDVNRSYDRLRLPTGRVPKI